MKRLRGQIASGGSRTGRAVHPEAVAYATGPASVAAAEVPGELERLARAVRAADVGLEESRRSLAIDPKVGSIFEVHKILLDAVRPEIEDVVRRGSSADHAAATVLARYAARFASIADPMIAERRQDVLDVERRLLRALAGQPAPRVGAAAGGEDVVLVAHDLTPSDAAALAGGRVVAIVLEHGGVTSHTAIIAKALGLPCLVGVVGAVGAVPPGAPVWVDAIGGALVVDPDEESLASAREKATAHAASEASLLSESHLPAQTIDGREVTLLGNIEFPVEVRAAVERGAAGVGLYRTEFLHDPSRPVPDEEEHLRAYRAALAAVRPGRLTIRTFDFGSDKATPGGVSNEANPALGRRSLRWCFAHPDVFRPQLRALLRIAAEGDVRAMLPMVGAPEDVRRVRALLAECARELAREGVPHEPSLRVGAMIEIPAAAATADLLAPEVDFFSIGTNDLVQYGLAVDRTNETVAPLFRPSHPGVLRWIRAVVGAAAARGIPVTMCGEMGAEPTYAILLLGLGVREFSLTPSAIPRVRRLVRSLAFPRARAIAARCLTFATADEVDAFLHRTVGAPVPAFASR